MRVSITHTPGENRTPALNYPTFRCSSMVEQRPVKALVVGSSPTAGAIVNMALYGTSN